MRNREGGRLRETGKGNGNGVTKGEGGRLRETGRANGDGVRKKGGQAKGNLKGEWGGWVRNRKGEWG